MELRDAVVVVTGASRGLGEALTRSLVARGSRLVVSATPSSDLNRVGREVRGLIAPADVTDPRQIEQLVAKTLAAYGRIDLWINNAGIRIPQMPVADVDPSRVHQMMEVNFFGAFYGCRAALRLMQRQGFGAILNILSSAALKPRPRSAAYAATKAALASLTQSLRLETASTNVRIYGAYPGGMKTRLWNEQRPPDFNRHMEPSYVAAVMVENLAQDKPISDLAIFNPDQLQAGAPRLLPLARLTDYLIR